MLLERMWRAALLRTSLYEEVERDPGATVQAAAVVVIASLAGMVGDILSAALGAEGFGAAPVLRALVNGIPSDLVSWLVEAYVAYFVGTRLFAGRASPGELLRTLGFASAPGVLLLFRPVPVVGDVIDVIVSLWVLVAMIVAIRQALDFGTGKAIATLVITLIPAVAVALVFDSLAEAIAGPAPG